MLIKCSLFSCSYAAWKCSNVTLLCPLFCGTEFSHPHDWRFDDGLHCGDDQHWKGRVLREAVLHIQCLQRAPLWPWGCYDLLDQQGVFFFFFWGVWPLVKSCLYWNCPWCIRFTCFLTEHSLNGEISVWIDILLHVLIAYLHLSSAWPDHVHSCKHEDLCQHF